MRRWRRCAALLMTLALLLTGCAQEADGVSLAVCLGDGPETLDPIYATAEEDQTVVTHLYENLMRVSVDVSGNAAVTNGLAKSYSSEDNHDGTITWTFKLRSAKWSDGRVVKAKDFVYAWQRLANPASGSPYASILSIVAGYDEVRETGDPTLLQVSAKNDSTLEVVLTGNYEWFLTEVCTSPATSPLREDVVTKLRDAAVERNKAAEAETGEAGTEKWWSQTENLVTNGPYQVGEYTEESLTLTAAPKYYGSQSGPENLIFRFADTAEAAQALYDEGAVDLIWPLTDERMAALAESETWTPITELNTCTVLFNCGRDVFADPLVRQALILAIDRGALAETAGVTARAAEGIIPAGVPGNGEEDFRTSGGALLDNDPETYADRCALAKTMLEDAGYDSGYHLGELEYLYVDTPENTAVAQALAEQWRQALNVRLDPVAVTEKELRTALKAGEYTLAGIDLGAVANDAECFLMQWTSDSENNVVRYENSAYDTLIAIIAGAAGGTASMGCLHDAEVLLLEDSVVAPLYTNVTAWTLRESYTGACRDARGWFCLAGVSVRST